MVCGPPSSVLIGCLYIGLWISIDVYLHFQTVMLIGHDSWWHTAPLRASIVYGLCDFNLRKLYICYDYECHQQKDWNQTKSKNNLQYVSLLLTKYRNNYIFYFPSFATGLKNADNPVCFLLETGLLVFCFPNGFCSLETKRETIKTLQLMKMSYWFWYAITPKPLINWPCEQCGVSLSMTNCHQHMIYLYIGRCVTNLTCEVQMVANSWTISFKHEWVKLKTLMLWCKAYMVKTTL